MQRIFLTLMVVLLVLGAMPVMAQDKKLEPPLNGQMSRLKVLDEPVDLPDIALTTPQGKKALSDFRGKLVILNLWATWCPPCLNELPSLNALQMAMGGDKLQVVAASLDTGGIEVVQKYLSDHNLTNLTPMLDESQMLTQMDVLRGVAGVPATLIINPQMKALALYEGEADWNGADVRAVLEYYMQNVSFLSFSF